MKLSEAWLRTWTNPEIDTETLIHQLTMAGLEVDSVEPAAAAFKGVVVAQITEVSLHPDADKLRVCSVNTGNATVQIVCGAANVRVGLKVACAVVGAVLPEDFKIAKAKLRGVESNGMLCGADELGFESSIDGLWELPEDAPVGQDIRDWLQLDDQVIDVDLTPNRADCLSVLGVAREVALLNETTLTSPPHLDSEQLADAVFPVSLEAPEACPRYMARVIQGVDLSAKSPLEIQERLRRSGIRVIDPVVDVTNYVMLEIGQPMHAFDLDVLQGGISVRMAKKAEKLTLLDGKEVDLQADVLVIADKQKALAMAGIMGGAGSGVSSKTTDILLESAFFTPAAIAGRARRHGLHTESSHRFERGVDPKLQSRAIERATELLLQIVGGKAGPVIEEVSQKYLPSMEALSLRKCQLELLIGRSYESDEIQRILSGLGCEILDSKEDEWKIRPPSWRFDLQYEVDLIEEIVRVAGYDSIPAKAIPVNLRLGRSPENQLSTSDLVDQMVSRGFREVITYSFISPEWANQVADSSRQVTLQNPLASDMSVMRPSMIPGLLETASRNLARQEPRLRIFESGLNFTSTSVDKSDIKQRSNLAALICGSANPENWSDKTEEVSFYQIKAELDALARQSGKNLEYVAQQEAEYLHPGQSATVILDGEEIGKIGAVHPQLLQNMDIGVATYIFEVDLQPLLGAQIPGFQAPTKYPGVRRDIAVVLDRDIEASRLIEEIKMASPDLLKSIRLFDIYTGQGIDSNQKSVAVGLTFRHSSRTLQEEDVNVAVTQIVTVLEQRLNAQQR
jgi:phenylalanyl-tRNA synthetase beta chain